MKKFLLSCIAFVSVLISLDAFAADSLVQKVYRIETYKGDELNNSFELLGHGSAVLVGKNKIITNAHVILGENDLPTGNYNLCVSDSFETAPKCKVSLKLLGYDKTNDLAILEPIESIALGTPVEMSMRMLELGEIARVYGYPSNGGETITLTEGKVSGLDNGHYKIDANIDAGNSGGGAFDKDGKFIGIPYIASVGYSTLGYIIPVSMIKDFFAGKGDIVSYGKVDNQFVKYMSKINMSLSTQKIDTPYIVFDGFQKKGFTLSQADEKLGTHLGEYRLYSKTQNTTILLGISELYGKHYLPQALDMDSYKELYTKVVEKKNIQLGDKKVDRLLALIGKKKEDGTTDNNSVSLFFKIGDIDFVILTKNYGSEKKALNLAIALLIKNLKIKKNFSVMDVPNYTKTPLSFDIISDMMVTKTLYGTIFQFDSNKSQEGSINIEKTFDIEGKESMNNFTFEERMQVFLDKNLDEMEIKKNSSGIYYTNQITISETKGKSILNFFYTKIDNIIYSITIRYNLGKEDPELEKKYYQLLDTVKLTGQLPFKSATIGKINSTSGGTGSTVSSPTIKQ